MPDPYELYVGEHPVDMTPAEARAACERLEAFEAKTTARLEAMSRERAMNDKPEAVAWLYEIPGANIRYAYAQRRDCFAEGWTETPLYAHPPSQPDASALVEALRHASGRLKWVSTANPGAGCDNGRTLAASWADDAAAALTAWEAQHG